MTTSYVIKVRKIGVKPRKRRKKRGGEMFNVWDAQEYARERRDKRLKQAAAQKAGGSISGCSMGSGGMVTGCHFTL